MIDFTNLPVRNKTYAGANDSKISVMYNNELYMLKFPAVPAINKEIRYANGCVSEYLGCHVFESVIIPVQKRPKHKAFKQSYPQELLHRM